MARPQIEIDMEQLAGLLRMKPTAEDCAAFFKCSVDTIERRIKEFTTSAEHPEGLTFAEFRDQNMVHTRFSLIRSAIKKSEQSDTMHIFCLKNLCDWGDKRPGEVDVVVNNITQKSDEDIDKQIAELMAKAGFSEKE